MSSFSANITNLSDSPCEFSSFSRGQPSSGLHRVDTHRLYKWDSPLCNYRPFDTEWESVWNMNEETKRSRDGREKSLVPKGISDASTRLNVITEASLTHNNHFIWGFSASFYLQVWIYFNSKGEIFAAKPQTSAWHVQLITQFPCLSPECFFFFPHPVYRLFTNLFGPFKPPLQCWPFLKYANPEHIKTSLHMKSVRFSSFKRADSRQKLNQVWGEPVNCWVSW